MKIVRIFYLFKETFLRFINFGKIIIMVEGRYTYNSLGCFCSVFRVSVFPELRSAKQQFFVSVRAVLLTLPEVLLCVINLDNTVDNEALVKYSVLDISISQLLHCSFADPDISEDPFYSAHDSDKDPDFAPSPADGRQVINNDYWSVADFAAQRHFMNANVL